MNEQNTTGKTLIIPTWVPLVAAAVGIIAILFFPWFSALGFGVGFFHILEHLGSIAELGGSIILFYAGLIFYICGSIVSIVKILKKTPMQEEDRANLLDAVDTAAGKVVNKMIFGLRDSLNQEAFLECVAGLEKVYED